MTLVASYAGKFPVGEREYRKLRKEFREYTDQVKAFIVLIDHTMKQPESVERGKRIADLTNKLELKNDSIRRFVLGLDFNGRPLKAKR